MKRFVFIPAREITSELVDKCDQTSVDTVRKSLNGLTAILSFDGEPPEGLDVRHSLLSEEEALEVVSKPEWSPRYGI